jgi:hypothetical protein
MLQAEGGALGESERRAFSADGFLKKVVRVEPVQLVAADGGPGETDDFFSANPLEKGVEFILGDQRDVRAGNQMVISIPPPGGFFQQKQLAADLAVSSPVDGKTLC